MKTRTPAQQRAYERIRAMVPEDDLWIDSMTLAGGEPSGLTAAQAERNATEYAHLTRIRQ
jgi:hypothetical protein